MLQSYIKKKYVIYFYLIIFFEKQLTSDKKNMLNHIMYGEYISQSLFIVNIFFKILFY
jgi:hypothetical protein